MSISKWLIAVHYENTEEFVETSENTNVVIAAFTTANARLKLYGVLEQLDHRVLYFDTYSIICVQRRRMGTADRILPWWTDLDACTHLLTSSFVLLLI